MLAQEGCGRHSVRRTALVGGQVPDLTAQATKPRLRLHRSKDRDPASGLHRSKEEGAVRPTQHRPFDFQVKRYALRPLTA